MSDNPVFSVHVKSSINDIPEQQWDSFANPSFETYNPFIRHTFLKTLEDSGCVGLESGWITVHLALHNEQDKAVGYMPCYLKTHSRGEFVFDHGWADAYERIGRPYYPKLQCAIPFTPVNSPKLLTLDGPEKELKQKMLMSGAVQVAEEYGASSIHLTFLNQPERELLKEIGVLLRTDHQFHWKNQDYRTFEDFLSSLSSRKRKAIKKERREALANDIEIEWITGSDLKENHWDQFFQFYMDTGAKKWGIPYLNRKFFSLLGERMSDDVLLVLCKREGRAIAGALNLIGGDCLYGRYWGAIEDHKFLHFETCYYQAIDFALERGLKRVEAGAQGQHKLARGYLPSTTYSAHYIADPMMRNAIADYLDSEREYVDREGDVLSAMGPYAKGKKT